MSLHGRERDRLGRGPFLSCLPFACLNQAGGNNLFVVSRHITFAHESVLKAIYASLKASDTSCKHCSLAKHGLFCHVSMGQGRGEQAFLHHVPCVGLMKVEQTFAIFVVAPCLNQLHVSSLVVTCSW